MGDRIRDVITNTDRDADHDANSGNERPGGRGDTFVTAGLRFEGMMRLILHIAMTTPQGHSA
jgi:hypothetical protein